MAGFSRAMSSADAEVKGYWETLKKVESEEEADDVVCVKKMPKEKLKQVKEPEVVRERKSIIAVGSLWIKCRSMRERKSIIPIKFRREKSPRWCGNGKALFQ